MANIPFGRLFSGGLNTHICCPEDIMKIQLPCREDDFNAGKGTVVERLQDRPTEAPSHLRLHGYLIRLVDTRHHIRRYGRTIPVVLSSCLFVLVSTH